MDAVDDYTSDDVREALAPIASLISKSEKAQQKLTPGTWQHTMLRDNLEALRIAYALMDEEADPVGCTADGLRAALPAIDSMIARTENVRTKFAPGTSQHSLQRNRLKALRIAEAVIKGELADSEGGGD